MDPQTPLTEPDAAYLRACVAALGRGTSWNPWSAALLYGGLTLGVLAGGQWFGRWFPARLVSQGLALCERHPTLRHGVVWSPASTDLTAVLRAPASLLTACASFLGTVGLIAWRFERQARRLVAAVERLHPELRPPPK